jgi:molybdate transport system substrate-binding protein
VIFGRPLAKRRAGIVLVAVFLAGAFASCAKKGGSAEGKVELVVLCGNSFVPPCDELVARFKALTNVEVVTTAAGSEDFLPLVKAGQKGDILITHDPYLDYVRDAKALADHVQVGFVAPVLAVQKGNPKGIKCIEDLAKPGLTVALSDPKYSTCGEMVAALLERKGIRDAVMKNVENRLTKGHGNLGTFLKTGAVDAVIMWNGVADTFKDSLDIVKTPYEYATETRVHVIGLSYSRHPDLVKRFVDCARAEGATIFARHGYVK